MTQELALTFIDFENIIKEAEQTYESTINFEKFAHAITEEHIKHNMKNCGAYAYSDFDESDEGVQTKLYRLGIQARHVVTKSFTKEKRANASDIELSLDIQSFIYENPLINHYVIISGDGDMLHIMQRMRLKGKTIHLITFERVNQNLLSVADHVTIYNKNAPFLQEITAEHKMKMSQKLVQDKYVVAILYQLVQLENDMKFVAIKFFDRYISEKPDSEKLREALTKAKKAGLIVLDSIPNPNNTSNPTSVIKVNYDNRYLKEIISKG